MEIHCSRAPDDNTKIILHGHYDVGTKLFATLNDAMVIDKREMTRIEYTYKGTDSSNKFDEPNERQEDNDDGVSGQKKIFLGKMRMLRLKALMIY